MITAHTDGALRLTAGALRLVEGRTTSPKTADIEPYVEAVSDHCPYLAPSVERDLTGWTVYEAAGDPDDVEAEVFHAGVQAAEWVRPLATRRHGVLVCENIVILGGHEGLLTWPHWVLKNLYGPVGLMFGKFRAGEQRVSRDGRGIPEPPLSFLPVRVAIRPRDPRFLAATPDLAATVAVAVDDGRDVFEDFPKDWKAVRAWAKGLLA
ncbi:hypothetical protein [Streptomyces sp. XD-27]|uniref:hypothetical protein n=1 Tax=Streptomyces sp. XD-27 TaxID=3062779 RepID=UPI0026F471BA|nr:hypothetical protein [Streptomyces sp. XD-27]WKX70920.1 hypothetical protein Q3Y56_14305 [Streptomyces sp. XD-27]